MQCHGALVEIEGVGVLLLGPSGVGKSECALELVRRGHRLVADDVVELQRLESGKLEGASPPQIRHYLEVRGLGILYVPDLFGEGAVLEHMEVHLVCHLDPPDQGREYERVGFDRPKTELAGVALPSVTVPARPAGSIATVVEVAARDHLLRRQGRNAARDLDASLREKMEQE
jgi:HPr kinase/phosphorylase